MSAPLPSSSFVVEVEQEVLGSLLLGNDMRRVSGILRAEHFVEPIHRYLFEFIVQAFERYGTTGPAVVFKMIPTEEGRAVAAKLGTTIPVYLASLAAGAVTGPNQIERSARKVVEQWARLELANEAGRLHAAASDPMANPLDLITLTGQTFDDIAADVRRGPKRKTRLSLSDATQGAFLATEKAMESGRGLTGFSWGLTDVNASTGGIHRRDLTLIAARPSMGKSTVGLSVGLRLAFAGVGVGFISLEMDAEKLAARAATDIAFDWGVRIAYADMIRGNVDKDGLEALRQATRDVEKLPLWIEDQSGLSMTDIRVKVEALIMQAQQAGMALGAIIVDHIGLIRASSRYAGNRVNEIAEISAGLKQMAREHDIAVIALSQLNRALEQRPDKRPQLSDLRDSGAIEQDADTIIFLYREAYYLERENGQDTDKEIERFERLQACKHKLEFHIAKQRNGPIKSIDLFVDMACSAVRNSAR